MRAESWIRKMKSSIQERLQKMIKCICSGEQIRVDELEYDSSESLATRDYSTSGHSLRPGEIETKVDNSNIEEAESSLRESGYLNYEEARALLGKLEYQKGNIEAALHVFGGINLSAITPKIKASISRRFENNMRHSQSNLAPSMSMHAVSLLLEAVLLKAKSLQTLGRFQEAAQSCKIIIDTVESSLPEGLPENFGLDSKLQETLTIAVELLPELWKLVGSPKDVILSYRRALLYHWNLDIQTSARIQKEFAIFLLYSGCEASLPALRLQLDGSFVPRNNVEEAVLLFLILLRDFSLGRLKWDASIIHHLSFALSVSGELTTVTHQVEELLPGTIQKREKYFTLALCYYGEGEHMIALDLLRNFLNNRECSASECIHELLLAAKICGENTICVEEGTNYAHKAIFQLHDGKCQQIAAIANCLLGVLLSLNSRFVASESERVLKQSEALVALETAEKMMRESHPYIVFHLCLEYAEQRKLNIALHHAKHLVELEAGSNIRSYILVARILSAQKQFADAEIVIDAALDQCGKWDQGELLQTKAKLQNAQGHMKNAVDTYTLLLAILLVQNKSSVIASKTLKSKRDHDKTRLEMEIWHDLANVYTNMSQWRDAEVCLTKSQAINPYSASRWHSKGLLYEARGFHQEALNSFRTALDIDPNHVPSLISAANVVRQLGGHSLLVARSLLFDALLLDRTNSSAWYNLGLLYKADKRTSVQEAAECFEAATLLEESSPVEPFR